MSQTNQTNIKVNGYSKYRNYHGKDYIQINVFTDKSELEAMRNYLASVNVATCIIERKKGTILYARMDQVEKVDLENIELDFSDAQQSEECEDYGEYDEYETDYVDVTEFLDNVDELIEMDTIELRKEQEMKEFNRIYDFLVLRATSVMVKKNCHVNDESIQSFWRIFSSKFGENAIEFKQLVESGKITESYMNRVKEKMVLVSIKY